MSNLQAELDMCADVATNLLANANRATGRTDANLMVAVDALCTGYGKGGVQKTDRNISIDEYRAYSTFFEVLDAHSDVFFGNYYAEINFVSNTGNYGAGIDAKVSNINGMPVGVVNRVGASNGNLAYGVEVYPGATMSVKIYYFELEA